MKPAQLVLPAVGLVSLLAGMLVFNLFKPEPVAPPAAAVPQDIALHSIPLTNLENKESVLSDWQDELLVVNFWAPWCAPCRREIPALKEVQSIYADRGVKVLGLSFDNDDAVRQFAAEFEIDYPLFLAQTRTGMYNIAFGNRSGSLPFTALLSRDLEILYQHNGELTLEQLQTEIDARL